MQNNSQFYLFANKVLDEVRIIHNKYFQTHFAIDTKTGNYPVTKTDLEIETLIRDEIIRQYPTHGIIGEEFPSFGESSDYVWVVDPVDGTAAFASGKPTFTTLIALLCNNQVIMGIVDQPILKQRFSACYQSGATLNNQPIKSSDCRSLKDAKLSVTTPLMFKNKAEKVIFESITRQVKLTSFGGDGYSYALLSAGFIDMILESDLKYYDVASVIPLVEESGGVITDWDGNAITKNFAGQCLASANEQLHQLALHHIHACGH